MVKEASRNIRIRSFSRLSIPEKDNPIYWRSGNKVCCHPNKLSVLLPSDLNLYKRMLYECGASLDSVYVIWCWFTHWYVCMYVCMYVVYKRMHVVGFEKRKKQNWNAKFNLIITTSPLQENITSFLSSEGTSSPLNGLWNTYT